MPELTPKSQKPDKLSVTLMPGIIEEIDRRRDQRSTTINRCLERYFSMLKYAKAEMAAMFSPNEQALMLDSFNGVWWDTFSVRLAAFNVADAIEVDHLDAKWGVDGDALAEKLNRLSTDQLFALVDAAEVWWGRVSKGEQPKHEEMLSAREE